MTVETRGSGCGRARNVEQDGAAAAAVDGADIGADQDQQREVRRQRQRQRREQGDAHGGRQPGQRADDETDERRHQRKGDRNRLQESGERGEEAENAIQHQASLKGAAPGTRPGTGDEWRGPPRGHSRQQRQHRARACPPDGDRRTGTRRRKRTRRWQHPARRAGPRPTSPRAKPRHSTSAAASRQCSPNTSSGSTPRPLRTGTDGADNQKHGHQAEGGTQDARHQPRRGVDRRLQALEPIHRAERRRECRSKPPGPRCR